MAIDPIIRVDGVSKKFCRSLQRTMLYGVGDIARDIFGAAHNSDGLRRDEFWALDDISFQVKRGECLGLIGANGAGKSTLLKLLNGITLPDRGSIKVGGRVGGLLELGAGFHPMLSGRENIYLNAAILGLTKAEITEKFDAIVDFANLHEFIDSPVKQYSSGMYVRLGFAIAASANPEIFLIDEALAVGDIAFQAKCFAKFQEFREKGVTVLFVTHNLNLVMSHCSRVLLLDRGAIVAAGEAKEVVDYYNKIASQKTSAVALSAPDGQPASTAPSADKSCEWRGDFAINPNEDRYGNRKAEILEAGIFAGDHQPAQTLHRNQPYAISVKVRYDEDMPAAIVAFSIKNAKGIVLCGTNTLFQQIDLGMMSKSEVVVVTFRQQMVLNPGEYLLCLGVAAYEAGEYVVYDRRFDYLAFQVVSSEPRVGLFDPDSAIEWSAPVDRGR